MDTTVNFYEPIEVWRRVSESEMVRYRCFRNSLTRRYSVQSSDFYQFPIDPSALAFWNTNIWSCLCRHRPTSEFRVLKIYLTR
jgi:hypothetical protein